MEVPLRRRGRFVNRPYDDRLSLGCQGQHRAFSFFILSGAGGEVEGSLSGTGRSEGGRRKLLRSESLRQAQDDRFFGGAPSLGTGKPVPYGAAITGPEGPA